MRIVQVLGQPWPSRFGQGPNRLVRIQLLRVEGETFQAHARMLADQLRQACTKPFSWLPFVSSGSRTLGKDML